MERTAAASGIRLLLLPVVVHPSCEPRGAPAPIKLDAFGGLNDECSGTVGVCAVRVFRLVVWGAVSSALLLGVSVVGPAWADPDEGPDEVVQETARPEWISASVTAKASGERVEVLSERTETTRVWVHPDGSVEEEIAFAPVRFEDSAAEDGWREIDTTLHRTSEGVRPVALPGDVILGSGDEAAVFFESEGAPSVSFGLDGVSLPEPVLDGSRALYEDVLEGVDLSVEVRSAGFEVLWVVKSAEAAQVLAAEYGVEGEVRLPVVLETAGDVVAGEESSLEVHDLEGEIVGVFGDPVMWDAAAEIPGEPGEVESLSFELPSEQPEPEDEALVEVVADQAWLIDDERVFPVVIDPTYAVATGGPAFDTFVQQGFTTDQSTSGELKLGNNGSGQVARSFLNFNASLFKGRQIVSADLSLYESWSWSCTARSFSAYDSGLASTASRWTSQPSIGTKRASLNVAKGYSSSCPAGRVTLSMTAQAQAWSSTSASQVGMMLRADSETDTVAWKRFHSSEGQHKPVLTVRYNRAPNTPSAPTVVGAVQASGVSGANLFVGTRTPVLRAVISDPDADTVKAQFIRYVSETSFVTLCESGMVASGATVSCTSAALPENATSSIRVRVWDGRVWSGISAPTAVKAATMTPVTPAISCPSGNGSWGTTVKAAETCTVTLTGAAGAYTSAPTSVRLSVNGAAWETRAITQPYVNSPSSVTIKAGGSAGGHTVRAIAVSPTGKQSATATYSFGYGKPSVILPLKRTTTHSDLTVDLVGPPRGAAPSVTVKTQWRVKGSPAAGWADALGSSSLTWNSVSGPNTTPKGRFDVGALAGTADGSGVVVPKRTSAVVELRGCFTYAGSAAVCTDPVEIVRVPHAFGSGFPVTDAGDGQVALWTGEFQASATDAELSTPDGGLSVSRVHSTFAGAPAVQNAVFGPGWVASFEGNAAGVADAELIDNTLIDGTLVLVGADGSVLPFAAEYERRTTAGIQ